MYLNIFRTATHIPVFIENIWVTKCLKLLLFLKIHFCLVYREGINYEYIWLSKVRRLVYNIFKIVTNILKIKLSNLFLNGKEKMLKPNKYDSISDKYSQENSTILFLPIYIKNGSILNMISERRISLNEIFANFFNLYQELFPNMINTNHK